MVLLKLLTMQMVDFLAYIPSAPYVFLCPGSHTAEEHLLKYAHRSTAAQNRSIFVHPMSVNANKKEFMDSINKYRERIVMFVLKTK